MADRTVKVSLVADVARYNSAVQQAEQKTEDLNREAERFDGKRIKAQADVDTAKAQAKLAEVNRHLDRIDGRRATANVSVDTKKGLASVGALASGIAAIGPAGVAAGAVAAGGIGALSTVVAAGGIAAVTAGLAFAGLGDAISAAADGDAAKLEESLKGMDKSARSFVQTVAGLKPQLRELQNTAQAGILPGAEEGLKQVVALMPNVQNLIRQTSTALGELAREGGTALNSPFWRNWLDTMAVEGPVLITGLARSVGNLVKGFAGLSIAFAPVARDMVAGLQNMSQEFANWATTLDSNQGFQEFIDYVRTNGPVLVDTLASIGQAIVAVAAAAAPLGPIALNAIKWLAEALTWLMQTDAGPWIMGLVSALGALNLVLKANNAMKVSALGTALANLGTQSRQAAAGTTAASAGMTTLGGAAGRAQAGTGRFMGAISAIGRNLPLIGAALIGGAMAFDSLTTSAAESAEGLQQTGEAGIAFRTELAEQDAALQQTRSTFGDYIADLSVSVDEFFGLTNGVDSANRAFEEHLATLTPLEAATARQARAQGDLDAAIRTFGPGSREAAAAQQALALATDDVGVAQQLAGKTGADFMNTLQNIVAQGGAAGAAAERYAAGMRTADLAAMGATVSVNGFGQVIATLPNGKTVVIAADVNQASADVRGWVETTNLLQANPTVQPDLGPANTGVQAWDDFTSSLYPTPGVGANTAPATSESNAWNSNTAGLNPVPNVDANTAPATAESNAWNNGTLGLNPVPTVSADAGPATDTSNQWNAHTDSLNPEAHVRAEDGQARSVGGAFVSWVSGLSPVVTVTAILKKLFGAGDITSGVQRTVHMPMANGGLTVANAPGNHLSPYGRKHNGKALRNMPGGGARMVPPNTWRVVGDRMDVPELYAPLDGSGRSRSLIAQGAATFGMSLVDTDTLSKLTGRKYGHAKPASVPQPVESQARAISTANQMTKNVTVNAPIYNPVAERGSDSVQSRLSRLADLGLFGE